MQEKIRSIFNQSIESKKKAAESMTADVEKAAKLIIEAVENKGKILICGNGGSAADSQHFATELVVRYEKDRKALPAIALTTDTSFLTAWSNDDSFETIFERQVEALGKKGDILIGISTSGGSENVILGLKKAKELGMKTISLIGKDGGRQKGIADLDCVVKGDSTPRIQECQQLIYHTVCWLVEKELR